MTVINYYVTIGLANASTKYSEKQNEGKVSDKIMFELAWEVKGLESLNEFGRKLITESGCLKGKLTQQSYNMVVDNFPKQLSSFKEKTLNWIKKAYKYHRTPATHILVVMISPEERNKKPYAIPIQCIAYASLSDEKVRGIFDKLTNEMVKRGMKVAGM